jgi:hypothetical protein
MKYNNNESSTAEEDKTPAVPSSLLPPLIMDTDRNIAMGTIAES